MVCTWLPSRVNCRHGQASNRLGSLPTSRRTHCNIKNIRPQSQVSNQLFTSYLLMLAICHFKVTSSLSKSPRSYNIRPLCNICSPVYSESYRTTTSDHTVYRYSGALLQRT